MDIFENKYNYNEAVGGWLRETFGDPLKTKERESALKDAEAARQQQVEMMQMMNQRKAMSSNPTSSKQTYIILGGVAVIMVIAILKFS